MVNKMYVVQFTDGTQVRFWCAHWLAAQEAAILLEKHNHYFKKKEKIVLWMEDNAFLKINDPWGLFDLRSDCWVQKQFGALFVVVLSKVFAVATVDKVVEYHSRWKVSSPVACD